jgi:arylsulfatase
VPLERPIGIEHAGNVAVITEKWKLTADGREPWRLFDLTTDRFERRDLAAQHPEIVEQLAAQWQVWAQRVGALRHGQP